MWAVDQAGGAGNLTTNQMIFKSTELGKLNVYNRADTELKLGHLSDVIVDAHTGQVVYGILDTGLFGKLIVVPWNALQLQEDTANRKSWLTLNKTSDDLKNAPTFDKSNPPDFASSQWAGQVDGFFGVRTAERPTESGQATANDMFFRSNELEGSKVVSRADAEAKLGHLSNLIIDAHTGQVLYGILDTGVEGKYISVPWSAFQVRQVNNKEHPSLTLNKTSDELKNAPSFDMKTMPDFTSAAWTSSVDRFFGVHTAGRSSPRE